MSEVYQLQIIEKQLDVIIAQNTVITDILKEIRDDRLHNRPDDGDLHYRPVQPGGSSGGGEDPKAG